MEEGNEEKMSRHSFSATQLHPSSSFASKGTPLPLSLVLWLAYDQYRGVGRARPRGERPGPASASAEALGERAGQEETVRIAKADRDDCRL